MEKKINPDLMPALEVLHAEGLEVYAYDGGYNGFNNLFWFQDGRVLNIQSKGYPGWYVLSVSYKPSIKMGSGCALADGSASALTWKRSNPTWVTGITNYTSIEGKIKDSKPLRFYKLNPDGTVIL
jgi:hypothetical protein